MDYSAFDLDRLSELVSANSDGETQEDSQPLKTTLPARPAQRRLWFMDQLEPGSTLFNLPFCVRIEGDLDTARFTKALEAVICRQPALRCVFNSGPNDDVAMQIGPLDRFPLTLEHRAETSLDAETLAALAEDLGKTAFNLADGPLFHLHLLRCGCERSYLFATFHHICFDGWSIGVFFNDLRHFYEQKTVLDAEDTQIARSLQHVHEAGSDLSGLPYWRNRLKDVPVLRLPTDWDRPTEQSHAGDLISLTLPAELCERMAALAQAEGTSLFVYVLGAWQLLLARYSGQERFAVGVPVSGREVSPELEDLIGMFVNTVPLMADAGGNPSWRSYLTRLNGSVMEAFGHKETPFDDIVAELGAVRDPAHHPVYQVGFILQNQSAGQEMPFGPLTLIGETVAPVSAQLDAELQLWPTGSGYRCDLIYCTALFAPQRMARMLDHFRNLLTALTDSPDLGIDDYDFLQADEIRAHQALVSPVKPRAGLLDRLGLAFCENPARIAVRDDTGQWSYRELESAAQSIAAAITDFTITPAEPIAVLMPPSRWQIASILGILLAGGSWVGLDSRYPKKFLNRIIKDCGTRLLLTSGQTSDIAAQNTSLTRLSIDTLPPSDHKDLPWRENPATNDRAYIIYTSGSTGEPKGVIGTRSGIVNRHQWICDYMPPRPDDVFCYKTTLGFVDSVQEILSSLLIGGELVIAGQEAAHDASALLELLAEHKISRLTLVPSLLATLLDLAEDWQARLPQLRLIISSGETLPITTAKQMLHTAPDCVLLNIYGSSEVSADVSFHQVTQDDIEAGFIPIGCPISGCQLYVVDDAFNPVPFGQPGELLVGGSCLSLGYCARMS